MCSDLETPKVLWLKFDFIVVSKPKPQASFKLEFVGLQTTIKSNLNHNTLGVSRALHIWGYEGCFALSQI